MKFSVSTYSLSGLVGKDGVTEKDLIKIAKEIFPNAKILRMDNFRCERFL